MNIPLISPHIEICQKGTDFEEFEKKWISAIYNNNNNKQTFKTATAYQLAVKNNRTALSVKSWNYIFIISQNFMTYL